MGNETLTVEQCLDKYELEWKTTVINDGKIKGFCEEDDETEKCS